MDNYDLNIICPECRTALGTLADGKASLPEECSSCGFVVQSLHGVPVLGPTEDSEKLDLLEESKTLPRQDSAGLVIPFLREALASDELVLELGAGVDVCDNPQLIKTDAYLYSSDLHCLADAHALPFADNSFGYVYSLAVFEHLHSPWVAAEEIWRVLKPGGKVFTLTAFMQHMHGYPHHYFNMTTSGLRQIFKKFTIENCAPSKWSNVSEIAYILCDLNQLIHGVCTKELQHQKSVKEIQRSVENICKHLPPLNEFIMDNWREDEQNMQRIAPAVEISATKI